MARYISLSLVNEQGTPHAWPGTPTSFEIGTEQAADKVWIGVSQDGANNQVYPLDTPIATIRASWPRIYQGVKLNLLSGTDDSPAQVTAGEYVYSNSLEDFNRLVAACCISENVEGSPSPGPCMITVNWTLGGNNGEIFIEADGVEQVLESGNGAGSFQVQEGAAIHSIVTGGNAVNELKVTDSVDGEIYISTNGSGEFGEDYTFNAVCGRVYTIDGIATPGE